jgi:hypothetical protein
MKYLVSILLTLLLSSPGYALTAATKAVATSSVAGSGCSGTYGNTTDSATGIGEGSSQIMVKKITGACNGTIASITGRMTYFSATDVNYRYSFVIYSDSGGEPSTLLGHVHGTAAMNNGPADQLEAIAVATGATTFWIGASAEGVVGFTYTATTGGTSRWLYNCASAWDAPPATWGTGCTNDTDYINYNIEFAVTY